MLTRYCQRCDDGAWDDWQDLFAPDATFSVLGRTYEGPPAIRAFLEAAMPPEARGKHVLAQSDIEVDEGAGTATAVSDYVFVARAGEGYAITSAGRYHDTFTRGSDGAWRFRTHEIRFL